MHLQLFQDRWKFFVLLFFISHNAWSIIRGCLYGVVFQNKWSSIGSVEEIGVISGVVFHKGLLSYGVIPHNYMEWYLRRNDISYGVVFKKGFVSSYGVVPHMKWLHLGGEIQSPLHQVV